MRKIILSLFIVFVLTIGAKITFAAGGFDQFGFNYDARIFSGLADGADMVLDGKVWGDPTFANDHLVIKWNAAWDNCNNYPSPSNCKGAWTDNEWNGKVTGGSGRVLHFKIIWIGDSAIPEGAIPYGSKYAVIMGQGSVASGHFWLAHGIPTGYGAH